VATTLTQMGGRPAAKRALPPKVARRLTDGAGVHPALAGKSVSRRGGKPGRRGAKPIGDDAMGAHTRKHFP